MLELSEKNSMRLKNEFESATVNELSVFESLKFYYLITKIRLFKYTENFTTQKWKFSDKKFS